MKNQRKLYRTGRASGELNMQLPRKMSAHNVMASISRTLGTRHDTHGKASNEVKLAGEESKDKLYEPKHRQKAFRVMIVIAYVICVSLAAIILSLYYAFIWDPKDQTRSFTISQSKINITSKVECLNRTVLTPFNDNTESNDVRREKIIEISSENNTKSFGKFKSIFPPWPIYIANRENLSSLLEEKTFTSSSLSIFPINTKIKEVNINNTDETITNQYNLPKR